MQKEKLSQKCDKAKHGLLTYKEISHFGVLMSRAYGFWGEEESIVLDHFGSSKKKKGRKRS